VAAQQEHIQFYILKQHIQAMVQMLSSQLQMMVLQMYQFQSLTVVLIIQQVKLLQYLLQQSAVLVAT